MTGLCIWCVFTRKPSKFLAAIYNGPETKTDLTNIIYMIIIPLYNLIWLKAENETSMPPARLREPGKV